MLTTYLRRITKDAILAGAEDALNELDGTAVDNSATAKRLEGRMLALPAPTTEPVKGKKGGRNADD